ncbi:spore coat protein D [Metabacillus crassostreae]|uniref:CotD family spore coat protein n=1 Tax=Metabacillus crassostreae TaxID=929098 RepID=UPI0019595CCE|nr:CotD family spore coat protein [Metabacillus crassostreae]MBM7602047.1 spore coat protein D [Metabacillus crassostreae]
MHCKPNVMAPIIHPTKCCVNHNYSETIVPHIHPQHTTTVNNEFFKHQHYFPQTQSVENEVAHQHFNVYGPTPGYGQGAPVPRPGFGPGPFFG